MITKYLKGKHNILKNSDNIKNLVKELDTLVKVIKNPDTDKTHLAIVIIQIQDTVKSLINTHTSICKDYGDFYNELDMAQR